MILSFEEDNEHMFERRTYTIHGIEYSIAEESEFSLHSISSG